MSQVRVPFLMYHAVQGVRTAPISDHADPMYTLTVEAFERQLSFLKKAGFQTITLAEFLAWQRNRDRLPPKPVVLTFDDGHPSHLDVVVPRLVEHGFRGTFAVVADWIGTDKSFPVEGLKTLQRAGMEIISHGLTHEPLTDAAPARLLDELKTSKVKLEGWLGTPVKALAIPRGYCSVRVRQAAYEFGYQAVCTSRPGYNNELSDPYNLARLPVRARQSMNEFTGMLEARWPNRVWDAGGYMVREGTKRILGRKLYDRLRGFILKNPPPPEG